MLVEEYFALDCETVQHMITETRNMQNQKSGNNGFQDTKVFLFDKYVVLKMRNINVRNVVTQDPDLAYLKQLSRTLLDLQAKGINTVPIFAFVSDDGNGYIIQQKAQGTEVYDRNAIADKDYVMRRVELLSKAPQAHFDKFIADAIVIMNTGVLIDFMGKDNFFYDENIGFQFIDLNSHSDYVYGIVAEKPAVDVIVTWCGFMPCYFDVNPTYSDTVTKMLSEMTEHECALLNQFNQNIFEKCKVAMINNGISEDMINATIENERFIPQKQLLKLL